MSKHWIFLANVYEACVETWCSTAVNERSMMCFYLNAHLHSVFSKDEAWAGADFSGLRDPEAMRRFMATSDYCFGYFDSDDEGTYDSTRECFVVELGMPRAGGEDEGAGNRSPPREGAGNATPPCVEPPATRNENPTHEELRRLDLEQLCEL